MSQEQPTAGNQAAQRRTTSSSFAQISRSRAVQSIGVPELIGLIGAAFLAVLVVFAYLYFYLPANSRRVSLELERTRSAERIFLILRRYYSHNDIVFHDGECGAAGGSRQAPSPMAIRYQPPRCSPVLNWIHCCIQS